MILNQHAVVERRDVRRRLHRAVRVERRRRPDHVVGLPLTRLAAWRSTSGMLLVDAARLAVHVGLVLVRIENLQLVAAVAAGPVDARNRPLLPRAWPVAGDAWRESATRGAAGSS